MIFEFNKTFSKTAILLLVLFLTDISLMAQGENSFIRSGNKAFEKGEFNKAEIDYKKALEKNSNSNVGQFNLGSAIHEQKNYDESALIFDNLTHKNLTPDQRAKSFYNLGNSLVNLQQYEQAVEAYKNSLRINPGDEDTKYNLLYAQQMLRQQQQNEQDQDNQQDQNQDQNQQNQEQNDQQNQDQNQDQNQQNQQNDQQGQPQDSKEDRAQSEPVQISIEDAERMLQALQDRERKTLEKIKKEELKNAKRVKTEKDW